MRFYFLASCLALVACGSSETGSGLDTPTGSDPKGDASTGQTDPKGDGGAPEQDGSTPPTGCIVPKQDVAGAVAIGATAGADEELLGITADAMYARHGLSGSGAETLVTYPRQKAGCKTDIALPAGFVRAFHLVASEDGSVDISLGKIPGATTDIFHQDKPTSALVHKATIANIYEIFAGQGKLYALSSNVHVHSVASDGTTADLANLAPVTIGGAQPRGFQSFGPYWVASYSDDTPGRYSVAWDARVSPPPPSTMVQNYVRSRDVLAYDGTTATFVVKSTGLLEVRRAAGSGAATVLYSGDAQGAWLVDGTLVVAEFTSTARKAVKLIAADGAKPQLTPVELASVRHVDKVGAVGTLADGRWVSVKLDR